MEKSEEQEPRKVEDRGVDPDLGFLDASIQVEDRTVGSVYPIIQWVNGEPAKKPVGGVQYTGGWFYSRDNDVGIPGAQACSLYTREGETVEGFFVRDLKFAPIRTRKCWTVRRPRGLPLVFAQAEYDDAEEAGRARGKLHVLAGIPGLDGPVVLVASGNAAGAIQGRSGKRRGALDRFSQAVVNGATMLATRRGKNVRYPNCAFYLTIGPDRDDAGEPVFTEFGQEQTSRITSPVWLDEIQSPGPGELAARFVGNESFAHYQLWHSQAESWVQEWSPENLGKRRTGGAAVALEQEAAASGNLPKEDTIPL